MVMVSHSKKFIFLKTRKTAGTSIEMALQPFCSNDPQKIREKSDCLVTKHGVVGARLPGPQMRADERPRYFNHMPARLVKEQLGLDIWQSYVKITSIRNPFTRAVSFFHFRERANEDMAKLDFNAVQKLFRDHILAEKWPNDFAVTHTEKEYAPDETIRFENLERDVVTLAEKLGLTIDMTRFPKAKFLPHLRRRPVAEYFDSETSKVLCDRMAWVFDKFDYSRDPNDIPNQHEVPQ